MTKKTHQHEDADTPEADVEHAGDEGQETPEETIARLEGEIADLDAKWKRALADAQNTRRQSRMNESEAAFQGARRVLEGVIPVLDHFDLALQQDAGSVSADQIIGGVRLIRDELLKALASHNIQLVEPKPGDEFDPNRHEAMMRQPCDDVEPGSIMRTLQVGYVMGDRTLRPAKVIIASGDAEGQG